MARAIAASGRRVDSRLLRDEEPRRARPVDVEGAPPRLHHCPEQQKQLGGELEAEVIRRGAAAADVDDAE
eukprot:12417250-Karenia_brevis.AAC.1